MIWMVEGPYNKSILYTKRGWFVGSNLSPQKNPTYASPLKISCSSLLRTSLTWIKLLKPLFVFLFSFSFFLFQRFESQICHFSSAAATALFGFFWLTWSFSIPFQWLSSFGVLLLQRKFQIQIWTSKYTSLYFLFFYYNPWWWLFYWLYMYLLVFSTLLAASLKLRIF